MEIDHLVLGGFETNCYVVRAAPEAQTCWIIDPGFSAGPLVDFLRDNSLAAERILLTHGHCDHMAGIKLLRDSFGSIPVGISRLDAAMLNSARQNLSWMTGRLLRLGQPDVLFEPGDIIKLGEIEFKVLATPGHTPGGVSFYAPAEQALFCGDTLFAGSVGRDDFPGGNRVVLLTSIHQELFALPDETTVYPGHGPTTTIGQEKRTNPFLQ